MRKKTRVIIFALCIVLFCVATPYIVLYSLGYRIDVTNKKIVGTGGIYVKAFPQGTDITIDSKISNKTGLFSNYVFVQNLLPGDHTVSVIKDGYHDYKKNLLVKENEATKLENVTLFKQKNDFVLLSDTIDNFFVAPNNHTILAITNHPKTIDFVIIDTENQQKQTVSLNVINGIVSNVAWSGDSKKALLQINTNYFLLDTNSKVPTITLQKLLAKAEQVSFNQQDILFIKDKKLYSSSNTTPIAPTVLSYQKLDQTIWYFASDGFLYAYDIQSKTTQKVTLQAWSVKNATYRLIAFLGYTFLQEDQNLLQLNSSLGIFKKVYNPVKEVLLSSDGQKIAYYNDNTISYELLNSKEDVVVLQKYPENIKNVYWVNNDYLIAGTENNIFIFEIDARGNVNTITLPKTITLDNNNINIASPKVFFNQQDKKLYLLTNGKLLVSEKLVP